MMITQKEVAKAAGVSNSTAGMILSGSGARYSESTRRKVFETAERLGYQKSINAKALRLRRSLLFGVLFSQVNSIHAADFLHGLQEGIAATDFSPLVFFNRTLQDQLASLDRCLNRRVDALLVNCVAGPGDPDFETFVRRVADLKIPVFEVFGSFIPGAPAMNLDMAGSGAAATRHLIDLGHRRIALVTHARFENRVLHGDAGAHADGYRAGMALAGLSPQIVAVDLDYDLLTPVGWCAAGSASLDQLLASPAPPTAVVCYNDLLAYGLNRACRRQGIAVPAAMSIIGNGDMMLSTITGPPLTTMRFDGRQAGLDATRTLLRGIEDGNMTGLAPRLELVLRESTATVGG